MLEDCLAVGIGVREQQHRRYQQYEYHRYDHGAPSYYPGRLLSEKLPDFLASCLYVVHGLGLWLLNQLAISNY